MNIKNVLYNTVKELPVTLEEIRFKAEFDQFIREKRLTSYTSRKKTEIILFYI